MSNSPEMRGGATVGVIADFETIEAASVMYLRKWCDGPESRLDVHNDLALSLGPQKAERALASLSELCSLCTRHGRRPLMRHGLKCKCVGADEACFAHFIGAATDGAREDAMLIATLLVRPDVAPVITALATDFGLALKQMDLAARRTVQPQHIIPTTLH